MFRLILLLGLLVACTPQATELPTPVPSSTPPATPTNTVVPTPTPTTEPPTVEPTLEPTQAPTLEPTPTEEPTAEPTPERLSGEALIAEVEANVTVECVYVEEPVINFWGTDKPIFRNDPGEKEKVKEDPNLCFVEDEGVPSIVELNRENPAYRTLFLLGKMIELVVAEDNDKWGEKAAKLRIYKDMSAEEIAAKIVEDGYSAYLPTFSEKDELGRFAISSVQAPNLRNITFEVTHGAIPPDEPKFEDDVFYGVIGSDAGFQLSEHGLIWRLRTGHSSVSENSAKFLVHAPMTVQASRLVMAANRPVSSNDLSLIWPGMDEVESGRIKNIIIGVGLFRVSGGHNFD